jgi:hypothetical protein
VQREHLKLLEIFEGPNNLSVADYAKLAGKSRRWITYEIQMGNLLSLQLVPNRPSVDRSCEDFTVYVFPHLSGSDPAPVPGYSTVFPLYQRVQYAMSGERLENY